MPGTPDDNLWISGDHCDIRFAVGASGTMPGKTFVAKAGTKKGPTETELAGFRRWLQHFANTGERLAGDRFEKKGDKIHGLRSGSCRLPMFEFEGDWYVTGGFKKKRDGPWRPSIIKRALATRTAHIEWHREQQQQEERR